MIKIKHLTFSYNMKAKPVLNDFSLEIKQSEFFGIIGPNGAGKTTLFKLLLGFLSPSKGTIELLGKSLKKMKRKEIADQMRIKELNDYDEDDD